MSSFMVEVPTVTQPPHAKVPERWALITGCSSGIGKALVGQLRGRGWGVVATARALSDLGALDSGPDLLCKALDVTDPRQIERLRMETEDFPITALVNNAGYGQVGPLELLTEDELRRQFETNVIGLHAMTRAFLPVLRRNAKRPGDARVVQVASMLGRLSIPLAGPYNASKHAVVALAETLRLEVGPEVRVILVEPGAFRTRFRDTLSKVWGDLPERVKGTRYERILEAHMTTREAQNQRWGGSAEACAARIAKAMDRRRPPRRLAVGKDAIWVRHLKALLPEALWEWLLKRTYGFR
ncbi:MAG: SDR family oxidoreductase [Holophagaceae bacterium]|nr:SDR family oxidoreductase [Holophagaceae bacterium]